MCKRFLVWLTVVTSWLLNYAQNPSNTQNLPNFEFIQNFGQWHPAIRYKAQIPYGEIYLESTGITYKLTNAEDYNRIQQWKHDNAATPNNEQARQHAVRLQFENTSYSPKLVGKYAQAHYYNYFLGSERKNWKSKIHPVSEVVYQNVYPNIDYEISGQTNLKYQWVIHQPSRSKIDQIAIRVLGADAVSIENEQLIIETSAGNIIDDAPIAYQIINGQKHEIRCKFVLKNSLIRFQIISDYLPDVDLIIDPKLIFSTYSGSKGDNFGFTATYDEKGNLYAGGIVDNESGEYPVTLGALDLSWNGGVGLAPAGLPSDISISKYDSAGSQLLWATYLGGEGDEYPHSLVVDKAGNLIVYGTTYSSNYPHTKDCFDSTHSGGTDIIVSKFSEDGTILIGSTFIGGTANDGLNQSSVLKHNYADDYRGDIITDDDNNIYVATCTLSDNLPTKDSIQANKSSSSDGYIFELTPDCKELLWGTYLGGSGSDALYSIKLDASGNIYVGGGTTSNNLPSTPDVLAPARLGGADGIIAIFNKADKTLKKLSYYGTSNYDQIYFIDIDKEGRVYASGQTEGNITKTTGTYGENGKGQFIMRTDSILKNLEFETTFGNTEGAINLAPSAFLVDVCDHIYFSGWGSSVDPGQNPGSSINMPVTSDAYQQTTDGNDFYIIVLDKDAAGLLYATYFGGSETDDHVDGGTSRFDKKGVMYQSVCSSCPPSATGQQTQVSDFPTTPNAVFTTNPSIRCSNASFKIDLQIKTAVIADFVATPSIGCGPLDVSFTNRSTLGDSLIWDFGDGDTSTALNPKHTYEKPGSYTVRLTVIDSNSCNISDVHERIILVFEGGESKINAEYDPCTDLLTLENNSINASNYLWDFGDGNTSIEELPSHTYKDSGTYTIKLTINKGSYCESVDSITLAINNQANPEIVLYNVFTPNDDGINDCFRMDGKNLGCASYELKIFNRWGEKVFETDDANECWNGRVFNTYQILPEGTYFYILNLGGETLQKDTYSGIVELIR